MAKYSYTERVDAVVYDSRATNDFTSNDWFELALAALDQGGLTMKKQNELRGDLPWEEADG